MKQGTIAGIENENVREIENDSELDKMGSVDLNQQKHEINQCQSEVEEADNGLTQHKQRPKGRKWKLKVRITKTR